LDKKVSSTLDEESNVVGEWLDALFTQPIQWTPMDLDAKVQAFSNLTPHHESPQTDVFTKPTVMVNRVNHLVMKDGLKRVYTALQAKQWDVAENVIADVFKSVPTEAMTLSQRQQWLGLQFKLWQKQGKSDAILSQALQVKPDEQSPELLRLTAEAYAQTGDYKEAIRTLHPLLAMPTDDEQQDAKTALKSWERLSLWAKELQNPALEHKMLQGYYKATKVGGAAPDVALEPLKRLQTLEQLMGREAHALKLAQERVSLAKIQRNKAGYRSALKDVAGLYLSQGESDKAQKVLALLT
jgi:tetratricopeptide (TPR) repeat protein